jgi:predicted nuclease of predicted toxin-antitoxin system
VRFLADESCDFIVVTALRAAGHDVSAIVEINRGVEDEVVLALARSESRILLTEDKDFGLLTYAGGLETAGVVLIRFPGAVRRALGQAIVDIVHELGDRIAGAFVVAEPGRARISRPHSERRKSTDK